MPQPDPQFDQILEITQHYWGIKELRPLQAEAIAASLQQRDALVVMPTGGGKSLCYQVPPLIADRTDVVVSPLIALMNDQVNALRAAGYPAVALHGNASPDQRRRAEAEIAAGKARLIFVAPERLMNSAFLRILNATKVRSFAVDEAHCISHWGHDFRPEYRQLATLKPRFPDAGFHAFTATATQRVRRDIIEQLQLKDPAVLIGRFDRPNLVYRIIPRLDLHDQVTDVLRRHNDEAVIIYCLSRKDTESLANHLNAAGVQAAAYHAGMNREERTNVENDFANERLNVVVATVAFGMGIDRSNVRCVIHATMPKSIENYQQETGRAGRDGLEADCVLFYSAADVIRWESLVQRSAQDAETPQPIVDAAKQLLRQMQRFCVARNCRHKTLSEYFDQPYEPSDCNACDVCLDEVERLTDATLVAQKIISCVARVEQRFGAKHVVDVLAGANTEKIRQFNHDKLSTHGLLKDLPRKTLTNYIYQLIDHDFLAKSPGDYPVLTLNDASWAVLRGKQTVKLIQPKAAPLAKSRADRDAWDGVDTGLFEHLRAVRKELAVLRDVPPYVIFSDATLRDMARRRPRSPDAFRRLTGVGEKKLQDLGPRFLAELADYCDKNNLSPDPQ
jgi:ATP-dependent DNA helicase RecQ